MLSLVGHFNPVHQYPSPVVPIFQDEQDRIVAVNFDNGDLVTQPLPAEFKFVHYSNSLQNSLRPFDPSIHGLFAASESEIFTFERNNEEVFLYQSFETDSFAHANPFLTLTLAVRAGHRIAITRAIRYCLQALGANTDEFSRSWYERQLAKYPQLRNILPPDPIDVLQDMLVLRITCSEDEQIFMEQIVWAFNTVEITYREKLVQLVLTVGDAIQDDPEFLDESIHASIVESSPTIESAFEDDGEFQQPFASAELVLCISPAFAAEMATPDLNWKDIFEFALRRPHFKWIRPRNDSPVGNLIDSALIEMFRASDSLRDLPIDMDPMRVLHSKVTEYAPTDLQTFELAVVDSEWHVDVFVVHRHSLSHLLRDLNKDQVPVVLPFGFSSLATDYRLKPETSHEPFYTALRIFYGYVTSYEGVAEIENAGLLSHQLVSRESFLEAAKIVNARYERPIAVYLVADISGSMSGEKIEAAKFGIANFLGHLSVERDDVVGLIAFSNRAEEVIPLQRLEECADVIGQRISQLRTGGSTALLDALLTAWRNLARWGDHICAIVVLTDGIENASSATFEEAIRLFRSSTGSSRRVFGLAYGSDADYAMLEQLTFATGGSVYQGNLRNISLLYSKVAVAL